MNRPDNNWVQQKRAEEGRELLIETLEQFLGEHGHSPTQAELAELTGLPVSTVRRHIKTLIEQGRVVEGKGHRTLRLNI